MNHPITLAELIDRLHEVALTNPEMLDDLVSIEGCDCDGFVSSVVTDDYDNVYLRR